ncbi:MAG: linear amide C-N hydrolase [Clostridia bacterium]|nr:linear amide C-N hydrolase [Clostridia bacterium]
MCTAIKYDKYFGRNLDLWCHYDTRVIKSNDNRFPILGMGIEVNGYPLYFDGMNDRGLAMAGLNFPGNAVYFPLDKRKKNLAPYELIPYIIGNFSSVEEVSEELKSVSILNRPFSSELPLSPLHWMISDRKSSIVLESTVKGTKIYRNPHRVLTNSPAFDIQSFNMNNYRRLCACSDQNDYSFGMGAMGLPGDLSSMSRFVRAAFHTRNSPAGLGYTHLFRLLYSVAMQKGSVITPDGREEYTQYSCCCDLEANKYYYTLYDDLNVRMVEF